jgi:hypothetical protein
MGHCTRASRAILKQITLRPTLLVLGVVASTLTLALVGFGLGWFLSGQQIANLKEDPGSPSAISNTTAKPDVALPKADVPGKDFADLPRYPGSVRVEYQRHESGDELVLVETEHLSSAELDKVRAYYRSVFRSEKWTVAGFDVSDGEWVFFVVKGKREAIVEIGPRGGLLEIEMQMTEPQKDGEASDTESSSSQRSERTSPALLSTSPSDDHYDDASD